MTDTRPEISRLAAELRLLRERSGLAYVALAEQTPYSKSAWQRYLTAKALPPWSAVQELCRLVGEPQSRLRALWELAESVSSGRSSVKETTPGSASPEPRIARAPEPGTPAAPTRKHRPGGIATVTVIALCVMLAAGLAVLHFAPWDRSHRTLKAATTPQVEGSRIVCTDGPCNVTCQGAECTGLDPGLTLCGVQPQTLQHLETPTGIGLEVRYNPQCRAAWARIWNTRIGDTLTLAAPGIPTQSMRVSDAAESSGFTYTPMVFVSSSAVPLKACVSSAGEPTRCYTATAS